MKVKVALDTNVLMDLLLEGRPEKESAEQSLAAAEAGLIEAQVSTQSIIDAAFTCRKQGVNREALRRIVDAVGIPVQNGGGIRNMDQIRERLDLGVSRVIIGTAAVKDPAFLEEALCAFGPDRIVVGIDASKGMVALEGWVEVSQVSAVDLGRRMRKMGLKTCVYTDISRDGMLTGPNIEETVKMQEETGLSVIASGGVSSMEDLVRLDASGLSGVIIGKAIYEGRIDFQKAAERFES